MYQNDTFFSEEFTIALIYYLASLLFLGNGHLCQIKSEFEGFRDHRKSSSQIRI